MEKLAEQQQKSVFQIIEELEANGSTLLAGHWAGAGKISYLEATHPDIDADFGGGVASNIAKKTTTIHQHINSNEEAYIIRDEMEHAMAFAGAYLGNSHYAMSMMESLFPEKEKVSPKEQKKRNKEALNKFLNKGRKW
jgi:hypothetical protein